MKPNIPEIVVLENVLGLTTSHGGRDMRLVIESLNSLGYSVDILSLDAKRFVPQSRKRLFIIATLSPTHTTTDPGPLRPSPLHKFFTDGSLRTHMQDISDPPDELTDGLTKIIKTTDVAAQWWDSHRTNQFLNSLTGTQNRRLKELVSSSATVYRTAFRRMRQGTARWEVRPDDIAGCLRTPRGGSSKQAVIQAGNGSLQARWLTPAEYAALMGAPQYEISAATDIDAYWGFGDAVCVPVVHWIAEHVLLPHLRQVTAGPESVIMIGSAS